jgi:hypothetical protein
MLSDVRLGCHVIHDYDAFFDLQIGRAADLVAGG